MGRKVINALWNRKNLNDINDNFEFLFETLKNIKSEISLDVWEELKTNNTISMLEPVQKIKDLPKIAKEKSLISVTDEQKIYFYSDGMWKEFVNIDLDPFSKYKKELHEMIYNQNNADDFKTFVEDNKKTKTKNVLKVSGDRLIKIDLYQNDNDFFTLSFGKNSEDDFIKFRTVNYNYIETTGPEISTIYNDLIPNSIVNGTVKGSGNNYYTTTVGASYTHTFTGTDIWMRSYVDEKGGVWQATIDGGTPKTISVNVKAQKESEIIGSAIVEKLIASNLENKKHTLVLKYLGEDPDYPSTENRGWFKISNGGEYFNSTFKINGTTSETSTIKTTEVIADSNKEFAFSVEANNVTNWVPMHYNIGTLFVGSEGSQKLFIDGSEKSLTKIAEHEFEKAIISQDLYGYHPELDESICNITIIATIDKNGVKFDAKTTWLQEVKVAGGYIGMQTINPTIINTLVSSYGKKYDLNIFDGTYLNLNEKAPFGFIGLSDTKDIFVTSQTLNGYEAYRLSEKDRFGDEYGDGLIGLQYRDKGLHKLYPRIFDKHNTTVGEVLKFSVHYGFGQLPFVNKLF